MLRIPDMRWSSVCEPNHVVFPDAVSLAPHRDAPGIPTNLLGGFQYHDHIQSALD
jgi:hypothetical protein